MSEEHDESWASLRDEEPSSARVLPAARGGAPRVEQRLLELLSGKWITAAIAAAAELGVADSLRGSPLTAADLAARLGCDERALTRLLRVLCGEGLCELSVAGFYRLTPTGEQLCEGRLRDLARLIGSPFMWTPWAELARAVREPERSAFEHAHGRPLFEYLDHEAEAAALYHTAVDAFTQRQARALGEVFDFSALTRVVDVGGGLGTVLTELAQRHASMQCVLYDRESVIERARARVQDSATRIDWVAGDFFESVPAPADAYIVKHVLHNWDDEHAARILRLCAAGLRPGGKVLVVENLRLPGNVRDGAALLDLEMLVLCGGGRERSKPEFRRLLRQSGLTLDATRELDGGARVLVASPIAI